ncbi:hypothetical protein LINPERHAP1_LOCUS15264, partial [Linum perenne]
MWGSVLGSGRTTPSTLPPGSMCRMRRRHVLSSSSSWASSIATQTCCQLLGNIGITLSCAFGAKQGLMRGG